MAPFGKKVKSVFRIRGLLVVFEEALGMWFLKEALQVLLQNTLTIFIKKTLLLTKPLLLEVLRNKSTPTEAIPNKP